MVNNLEGFGFTSSEIERKTGFALQIMLPNWLTDGAARIGFHDDLDYLEKVYGPENVIGSLCLHEGSVVLGVFLKKDRTIDGELAPMNLPAAAPSVPE